VIAAFAKSAAGNPIRNMCTITLIETHSGLKVFGRAAFDSGMTT